VVYLGPCCVVLRADRQFCNPPPPTPEVLPRDLRLSGAPYGRDSIPLSNTETRSATVLLDLGRQWIPDPINLYLLYARMFYDTKSIVSSD
jgi:hypothetical protein